MKEDLKENEVANLFGQEILRKIESVAKSGCKELKKTIPNISLLCERGEDVKAFNKRYESIITENHIFSVRGAQTYLELKFPNSDIERDYQLFFQSPKILAGLQNCFYGVFAISFEEWEGQDLIKSDRLNRLLDFISSNADNIYFIFEIPNDLASKEELINILKKRIYVEMVELNPIGVNRTRNHIKRFFDEYGIELEEDAICYLEQEIEEIELIDSKNGLKLLGIATENILFELCYKYGLKKGDQVSVHMLKELDNILVYNKETEHRIGFSV